MGRRCVRSAPSLFIFFLLTHPAAAHPHRVASLNLCTDELLVGLADPGDIASLSPLARDPDLSTVAAEARHFPNNRDSAEEILREGADLVLGESSAAGPTIALLRRLGTRVETVDLVDRLDQVAPTVRRIAAWLDEEPRGEAMVHAMEATLATLPKPVHRPRALIYESNGWSVGAGTLKDDLLRAAGYANQADALGLSGYGPISLEAVAEDPPDVLITGRYRPEAASLAAEWASHPVLRRIPRRIDLPTRLTECGTPPVVEAAVMLARANPATP